MSGLDHRLNLSFRSCAMIVNYGAPSVKLFSMTLQNKSERKRMTSSGNGQFIKRPPETLSDSPVV